MKPKEPKDKWSDWLYRAQAAIAANDLCSLESLGKEAILSARVGRDLQKQKWN